MLRATLAGLVGISCCTTAVMAQSPADRDGVRAAVLDYVEGFYEGDSARLVRSVWSDVRKYGFARPRTGGDYRGSAMPYPAFMSFANRVKANPGMTPANAPKEIVIYEVQDQTAAAKLTAYWGTDYLLLARIEGRWQITHVLWQTPAPK